jgi:hypothetical protein
MRRVGGLLVYNDRARRKDEARGSVIHLASKSREKRAEDWTKLLNRESPTVSIRIRMNSSPYSSWRT